MSGCPSPAYTDLALAPARLAAVRDAVAEALDAEGVGAQGADAVLALLDAVLAPRALEGLTRCEERLVRALAAIPRRTFALEALRDAMGGVSVDTVRVLVKRVREKRPDLGLMIVSDHGRGYRWIGARLDVGGLA